MCLCSASWRTLAPRVEHGRWGLGMQGLALVAQDHHGQGWWKWCIRGLSACQRTTPEEALRNGGGGGNEETEINWGTNLCPYPALVKERGGLESNVITTDQHEPERCSLLTVYCFLLLIAGLGCINLIHHTAPSAGICSAPFTGH